MLPPPPPLHTLPAAADQPPAWRFGFQAMGTPCELQLHGRSRAAVQGTANAVIAELARLEAKYSRYRADSLLSALNRTGQTGGRIEVDEETAGLLDYAQTCFEQSEGLFDISSGVLRAAWRFGAGQRLDALPEPEQIRALQARVGWQRAGWARPWLTLPAGMELDLGGVVKEYAADRVATLCVERGCAQGLVNLGGDIRVIGPHPDGSPWVVGIQHPEHAQTHALATLAIHRGAIATSGDYLRCITVGGRRYGHVLNPRTGWPVRHLASVTVVAEFCVVAGSASTIAMLREQAGDAWLAGLGLPYLWIDVHGKVGGPLAEQHRACG